MTRTDDLDILSDESRVLDERLLALQRLGRSYPPGLEIELIKIFARRPMSQDRYYEDPRLPSWVEYRFINAAITEILLRLGNRSTLDATLDYLGETEEQGSSWLVIGYIATRVLRIDDLSILAKLLAKLDLPHTRACVARSLLLFDLPRPPVYQPLTMKEFLLPRDLKFSSLGEEIRLLQQLTRGRLALAPDIPELIAKTERTFVRGSVDYRGVTIAMILRHELIEFGMTYFVTGDGVVVCSLDASAALWKEWWLTNRTRLVFQPSARTWTLAGS